MSGSLFTETSDEVEDDEVYSRSTLSEDAMYATERYSEAVHEDIGLLQVRTAFSLLKQKPLMAQKFAGLSISFVKELQETFSDEGEKRALHNLQSALELLIAGKFDNINVEETLKIVDRLSGQMRRTATEARDEYFRFFKRY